MDQEGNTFLIWQHNITIKNFFQNQEGKMFWNKTTEQWLVYPQLVLPSMFECLHCETFVRQQKHSSARDNKHLKTATVTSFTQIWHLSVFAASEILSVFFEVSVWQRKTSSTSETAHLETLWLQFLVDWRQILLLHEPTIKPFYDMTVVWNLHQDSSCHCRFSSTIEIHGSMIEEGGECPPFMSVCQRYCG